jgi:hypothetical protein
MADFQLTYVLKGQVRFWYDAFGDVDPTDGATVERSRCSVS